MARNIIDKIWDSHVLTQSPDGESDLFYIDFHLLHEASSPQAFEGSASPAERSVAQTCHWPQKTTSSPLD